MELTAIKLPVRTSYRLQLSFFRLYLRGSPPSVCPALLCNPRRNQVVPTDLHSSALCASTHARSLTQVKRLSHYLDMMASVLTQNDPLAPPGGGYYRRRRSGNIPAPISFAHSRWAARANSPAVANRLVTIKPTNQRNWTSPRSIRRLIS